MAKDEIRDKLKNINSFDITRFAEDTLTEWPGTAIKNPIRYSLNIEFIDSSGRQQQKRGEVIFAPDGKSIIHSQIIDPLH